MKNRILGALIGLHAGDSLGATLEFLSWQDVQALYPTGLRDIVGGGTLNWPAGAATDDTDLTLAVVLAYRDVLAGTAPKASPALASALKSTTTADLEVATQAGRHMLDWMHGRWPGRTEGQRPLDIGYATATGLTRFAASMSPERAGAGPGQAGNGSLMRCVPTALVERDPQRMVAQSMLISRITHDDLRCQIACAAYNVIVASLVYGDGDPRPSVDDEDPRPSVDDEDPRPSVEEAVERAYQVARQLEQQHPPSLDNPTDDRGGDGQLVSSCLRLARTVDVAALAREGPRRVPAHVRDPDQFAKGFVLDSLLLGVAALYDPRPLEDVLVDVVRWGRDADTNGAIAGGLLGARDGLDAIPPRWRAKLQLAGALTEAVEEAVHHRTA